MKKVSLLFLKVIKYALKIILILFIFILSFLNIKMYYQPEFISVNKTEYNSDVLKQLYFLKSELKNGAGMEMQSYYPEGFLFINAIYGLSWGELIKDLDKSSKLFKEGIKEMDWAFNQIETDQAKSIFTKELPLEYGAFYRGWSNYLLGKKLSLQDSTTINSIELNNFIKNCSDISEAITLSKMPYLESYNSQIWPADIMPCVASLKIHDEFLNKKFSGVIKHWIALVKLSLDTETGLIPHSVFAENGEVLEGARGSSQSLILNFLNEIDLTFSIAQFQLYKKHFVDSKFGLPGIREYPYNSTNNGGDVDSGPVLLGVGGAASIVGQRTMWKHEDWQLYEGLRNSIEGFGVGYTTASNKKYIFGQLPMADAFIVWSNSVESTEDYYALKFNWRIKFQLLSLVLILIFGTIAFKL
jgi:hypothetical protein